MRLLIFALFAAVPAILAQSSHSPSLGFVPGATPAELQPILGVPGAARLGDAVALPNAVSHIYLAPGHSFALAAEGETDPVRLLSLRDAAGAQQNPTLTALPGGLSHPDVVAFSPTGSSALLYSKATNQLEALIGLPDSPQLVLNIASLPITGNLGKLAISDDAQIFLATDDSGTLYSFSRNTAPVAVFHSGQISALTFLAQSHGAIVADPGQGTITILNASSNTAAIKLMASGNALESCQPQAAISTADGTTALVACPAQHILLSVNGSSGAVNTYNLDSSVSAFDTLGARDTFLMSPAEGNTYWLFHWQPSGPVVSFVAASRNREQGSGK